jgi:hypothetical protein
MKKLIFALLLVNTSVASAQVLWTEDFESYANGTTSGTAGGTIGGDWNSTVPGGTLSTLGGRFFSYQTTGEGEWITDPIDISGTGRVVIDMNVLGVVVQPGDYIQCYYRVDGGSEILFFEQDGGLLNFNLSGSAIVTGSSMEIIVRSDVDGGLTSFSFDDIVVTAVTTLYSRKSGDWDDDTGDATWSIVALGGLSCDCQPLVSDYLIIGNGNTVNINVAATAGGIEVQNTGSLQWTVDNVDLNIDRGILLVDGSINRNGRTGIDIDFDRGIISSFVVNGTITTEDIEITATNATVNISGSGDIDLTGDFRIIADDIVVNNDLTGTFTIGGNLVYDQPGDALSDDAQFVNNETLTVISDIVVGANNDDDNIFTNSAGAILNVVNINLADADFDFLNSGTVNQSGDFINVTSADTNIDNLSGGVWNWTFVQAAFDPQMTTVLNCTASGNTFNYGAAGNQRIIPVAYQNLNLSGTGAKDANNATFSVGGNWTVSGAATFTEGTGTLTLNGANAQTLTNPSGETFNNLIINNTFGTRPQITLNNATIINGLFTLTQGVVATSTSALLTLVDGATTNGGDADSYVDGPIRKIGNDAFVFPTGDNAIWARIGISAPATVTTEFTAQYFDANYGNESTDGTFNDESDVEYWTLDRAVTADGVRVTLFWENNVRSKINSATADLIVARFTGALWTNQGQSAIASAGATGNVTSNTINTFSPITFGSLSVALNPLPIELVDFTATPVENSVHLNWTTASELNNDFFTVERSPGGETFSSVGQVNGSGTTSQGSTYSLIDTNPLQGTSYYRLKQTDFDGTFTYSKVIAITYEGSPFSVYPNPSAGDRVTIVLNGLNNMETVPVVIYDQLGRECMSLVVEVDKNSNSATKTVDFENELPKGMYMIKAGPSLMMVKRFVVAEK